MKAAIIEMDSWLGHQVYLFTGENASEILNKFERIQDPSCLLQMGRMREGKKGQKQLDTLEAMLGKYYSGEISMQDLQSFDIKMSIGAMKCSGIAENDSVLELLKQVHPEAQVS